MFGSKPFTPASTPAVQPPSQTGLLNFRSDFNPQISSSNSMMTTQSKQCSASKQSATALPVLSSLTFGNDFNPPPNKPVENRDLFNQASKTEPKNSDMFGQERFTIGKERFTIRHIWTATINKGRFF